MNHHHHHHDPQHTPSVNLPATDVNDASPFDEEGNLKLASRQTVTSHEVSKGSFCQPSMGGGMIMYMDGTFFMSQTGTLLTLKQAFDLH